MTAACLETYQWTNLLARGDAVSAFEAELYRAMARRPELGRELLDIFSRSRRPGEVLTLRRSARFAFRAMMRPETDRAELLRLLGRELRIDVRHRLQRMRLAR